jgi:hypothetical protein
LFNAASNAPVFSPTRSMRKTNGGKSPVLAKLAAIPEPSPIWRAAPRSASSTARLPAISSATFMHSRTVIPRNT